MGLRPTHIDEQQALLGGVSTELPVMRLQLAQVRGAALVQPFLGIRRKDESPLCGIEPLDPA